MIQYAIHEEEFLNTCKYFREIYDSKGVQADEAKWHRVS
jgi:26S proteasome regulatory subunit N5